MRIATRRTMYSRRLRGNYAQTSWTNGSSSKRQRKLAAVHPLCQWRNPWQQPRQRQRFVLPRHAERQSKKKRMPQIPTSECPLITKQPHTSTKQLFDEHLANHLCLSLERHTGNWIDMYLVIGTKVAAVILVAVAVHVVHWGNIGCINCEARGVHVYAANSKT